MVDVFILGMTTYSFLAANHVWVLNLCRECEITRLKVINILSASSNFGLAVSAIIVSEIAPFGFNRIFFASGIFLVLAAGYLLFQSGSSKIIVLKRCEAKSDLKQSINTVDGNRNRSVTWLVLLAVFFVGACVAQTTTTYSVYIQNAFPNLGLNGVSTLFMLNALLVVFFQTPLVNFFGSYNKILMLGIGAFLYCFGLFMLTFSSFFVFAMCACIIFTVGEMLFFSMAMFLCYQKGNAEKKGHQLGMYRMTFAASRVVGPAAGGFIYHSLGGNMVWYISGAIGTICLIACNYYKKYA